MAATLSSALLVAVPMAPLVGAVVAGLFGKQVGRAGAHTITILGVAVAFVISAWVLYAVAIDGARFNATLYEWMRLGPLKMEIGFLVDGLTAMMMCVVTFVSLMVHVYTIGYMADDPGYQRFFSYISLFTFSMLMLVMSNNFLQLFFGWEAVGLVSYLLIGFWYTRPTAIFANMKAFLVNRVGDFGFILGIGPDPRLHGYPQLRRRIRPGRQAGDAGLPGHGLAAHHRHLHLPLHRRHGQERPVPASCVAARFHGRADPNLGPHPCRHHGHGRHLHGRPHVAAVRALRYGALVRDDHRRHHGPLHGLSRHHPERHQAGGRLFHIEPARLHDGGPRRLGLLGGRVPPHDACLLQGAALPRRGLGDHRHAPRPGHPQHGRPAQVHADHLDHLTAGLAGADRHAALLRLLFQGFDHRGRAREPSGRRLLSPTSRWPPASSSPPSIRSGCTSWSSTAPSASANRPFPPEDDHHEAAHDEPEGHGADAHATHAEPSRPRRPPRSRAA